MCLRSTVIIIACCIALSNGRPAPAVEPGNGTIYQWEDEQGVLHVSDSLEKVPKKFRSSVKSLTVETAPGAEQPSPEQSNGTHRRQAAPAPTADNEEHLKRAWQQRMREARDNVTSLTKELQSQEGKLRQLKDQWGSGLYGYPEHVAAQIKDMDARINYLKSSLEQAKKKLDEDLPDAARKAGIPPGWLRE